MTRRLVRLLLGPVVRWAAHGWVPNYYSVRGRGGAYLMMVGPFGEVYQRPMGMIQATNFADDLLSDAYDAAEDLPLPPDDSFGDRK